jgi:serine/threonine protein kinase/WD40 repeat protein
MADETSDRDVLLARLAEDFAARYRRGERPSLAEYLHRHPELADDIRELFPALAEVEQVKEDRQGPTPPPAAPPAPLRQLGDYRILREVGHGGMGVVYEAEQLSLGRHVALKVLPQKVLLDARTRRRFEREARAAARLHHSNIVPVYGVGEHDGVPFYSMQFIQGLGLDAVIRELRRLNAGGGRQPTGPPASDPPPSGQGALAAGVACSLVTGVFRPATAATVEAETGGPAPPAGGGHDPSGLSSSSVVLPGQSSTGSPSGARQATYWESVARIGAQVAGALDYAHKQGVLHRDVKPSNLLLDAQGTVWVADFGLAKAQDSDNLTQAGDILGTLRYMAPEAFEGRADARSDVYGLGLTLYELVALRPAFGERERNKLIKQVTAGGPPRLRKLRPDAPRDLVTVIEKATDQDPARRYQSAAELAADLRRFLDDEPILARRQRAAESAWRWCRHHPSAAALVGLTALLMAAATVGSVLAAGYFDRLRRAADSAAANEKAARQREEELRQQADSALADMYTARGLEAGDRDKPAEAALWFAHAARLGGRDPDRAAVNTLRARAWERDAVHPVRALRLAGGPVSGLSFHSSGRYLYVGATGGGVWDLARDELLPWAGGRDPVLAACWSPGGGRLAVARPAGGVEVRTFPGGTLVRRIDHPGSVATLAFSPDGRYLAAGGRVVRVWDCRRFAQAGVDLPHPGPVGHLQFAPAGDRLLTSCGDARARVFAVPPPGPDPLFDPVPCESHGEDAHPAPVFAAGGKAFVTVTGIRQVTWWDAATGRPTGPGRVDPGLHELATLASGPDGRSVVVGGYFGARLLGADPADPGGRTFPHTNKVTSVGFGRDGAALLTGSWDRTARLWSVADGVSLAPPLPHQDMVLRVAVAPDGRYLATAQRDGLVRVWRRPAGERVAPVEAGRGILPTTHYQRVGLRATRDRRLVVPGRFLHPFVPDGVGPAPLRVFEAGTGLRVGAKLRFDGKAADAALAPDGKTVAAVTRDDRGRGRLFVWEVAGGRPLFPPAHLTGTPVSVAVSPDSGRVAALTEEGRLTVFETRTGRPRRAIPLERTSGAAGSCVRYAADGAVIAAYGGRVNVVDPATGRPRFPPLRPGAGASWVGVAVSDDGRLVATSAGRAWGNPVLVWDLATGAVASPPLPHPDLPFGMAFAPDGRRLLTGCRDGLARVWDWSAGRLAAPPYRAGDEVPVVAFTSDGRFGVAGVRNATGPGSIHVWELASGKLALPRLLVGTGSPHGVVLTADGRRAIATARHDQLFTVDLGELTADDGRSTAQLIAAGELASGHTVQDGNLTGLDTDGWLACWRRFRARHPGPAAPGPDDP